MIKRFWNSAPRQGVSTLGLVGFMLGSHVQGVTLGTGFPELFESLWNSSNITTAQVSSTQKRLNIEGPGLVVEPSSEFTELQLLPDLLLPRYPSFNSQLLDQQLILYSIHLFLAGPPDILVVGSSRAIQGVEPRTLQQRLVEQGHPNLEVYNFSINGATAQVIHLLLGDILTRDQLPKLVIWADGSRAFNSGRRDRTYEQILGSAGFQQLKNGMQPILAHAVEPIIASCQDYLAPPSFDHASTEGLSSKLSFVSSTDSLLTGFGTDAKSMVLESTLMGALPCELDSSTANFFSSSQKTTLTDWGSESDQSLALSLEQLFSSLPFDLDVTGFLSNATEFEPDIYYQSYPYVAGAYDANYTPFSLQGMQTDATLDLVEMMQSAKIPLVFVNLPLTEDYLDSTRSKYEGDFLTFMQRFSQHEELLFVDLNQSELRLNHYFADPSHLNQQGARAVARQLAEQAIIPWPTNHSIIP